MLKNLKVATIKENDELISVFNKILQPYGVLITSISKKIPLINAVKAAGKRVGNFPFIHGMDCNQNCLAAYGIDFFWHCPPLKNIEVDEILNYCRRHNIKAIIPTRNEDVEYYSHHLEIFKSQEIGVMVSSPEVVNRCLDKKKFADYLAQASFPVIPTSLSLSEIEAPAYVVKERFGAGGIQVGLNLEKGEGIAWANKLQAPIFQPFIKGNEWSIDVYRSRKEKVMGVVARQRNLVEKGESQVTTTCAYPSLESLCKKVSETLNLYGHAVIQVIEDDHNHFHIVECNPRFGGASTASLAVGLDSFYWFLLECLHQNIENYPFMRSKDEIRQVRHAADWVFPWPNK